MIVLVTGANGFVGQAVSNRLAAAGISVRAAARSPLAELPESARWVRSPDLGQPDDGWADILEGVDTVVHCAARVHVMQDNSLDPLEAYRTVNRDGTLVLAGAAAKAGVRRFVFISSIKVNGEEAEPNDPYSSKSIPGPVDPYGISKLEAEQGLFEMAEKTGMEVIVIRPVLVYGPGVKANFQTIMKLVDRQIPLPLKSVDNRRSMVFLGNLSDLVRQAIVHPAAANRVFLASDGEDLSTAGLIEKMAAAMGRPPRLFHFPVLAMKLAARLIGKGAVATRLFGSLAVDSAETRILLDWQPPYNVEEGFAITAAAYREQSGKSA